MHFLLPSTGDADLQEEPMPSNYEIMRGDSLKKLRILPNKLVDCCVTSPPYWSLRDYGIKGQLGLERTPEEYVDKLVEIMNEVKRVLKDDGTLWLNIGDTFAGAGLHPEVPAENSMQRSNHGSYLKPGNKTGSRKNSFKPRTIPIGLKPKDLIGLPWKLAFALRSDGWYLRQDIIWHKPNLMPEPVRDRCTKSHEYIFLLTKSKKYHFNKDAIKEVSQEGMHSASASPSNSKNKLRSSSKVLYRNKRSVWTVANNPYKGAHFATFPEKLVEPCVLAGSRKNGTVLDPFAGSGTTGVVALKSNRKFIGVEINAKYARMATNRIRRELAKL